ncbi:MAG: FHA domain-containing protein [Anaerolineales bacterium]|jgi:hypothetical protein
MSVTAQFYLWFFAGLGGIGGWALFFVISLAAVLWLIYDSATRRIPSIGWKLGAIVTACFLLPAALYSFTGLDAGPLMGFGEPIFYLGLLGGVIPAVLAIGYFVNFRGMVGCPDGHVYAKSLGECPECAALRPAPVVVQPPARAPKAPPAVKPREVKPKAHAWLVADDGRSHQLNVKLTTVGKSSRNDLQVTGDGTVSRDHAKITEQAGRFTFIDLGSTNGSKVNGHRVRSPVLLQSDDVIELGDNTRFRFVTSGG